MTDQITAAEYRELLGMDDDGAPAELSAAEYRKQLAMSKSASLRSLDSSSADTENPAKTEFGQWLGLTSPFAVECEACEIAGRRFRFDWWIPELRIAIEYDGIAHHTGIAGAWRDAEKGNLAQLQGYLFLRVNAESIRDGTAFDVVERAIELRKGLAS